MKASAAGPGTGSLRRGASSYAAGDGDGRGPGDRAADARRSHVGEGCLTLLPPLVDCCVPVDGDGSNGGDKK